MRRVKAISVWCQMSYLKVLDPQAHWDDSSHRHIFHAIPMNGMFTGEKCVVRQNVENNNQRERTGMIGKETGKRKEAQLSREGSS